PTNSSINAQIVAGIEGQYGHYCPEYLKSRGVRAENLWINALMGICWFFDLNVVIKYRLFLDDLDGATSLTNLESKWEVARDKHGITNPKKGYVGKRRY